MNPCSFMVLVRGKTEEMEYLVPLLNPATSMVFVDEATGFMDILFPFLESQDVLSALENIIETTLIDYGLDQEDMDYSQ